MTLLQYDLTASMALHIADAFSASDESIDSASYTAMK